MNTVLRLMPSWAWTLLLGLLLVGVQQFRFNTLQADLTTERTARLDTAEKLGACRATQTNLLELTIEQNSALADLRASEQNRAIEAKKALQEAEGRARQSDQKALQVMQERTPVDSNACASASQAFDEELRRERGL